MVEHKGGGHAPEGFRLMRTYAPYGFFLNGEYVHPSYITTRNLRSLREIATHTPKQPGTEVPIPVVLPDLPTNNVALEVTSEIQSGD